MKSMKQSVSALNRVRTAGVFRSGPTWILLSSLGLLLLHSDLTARSHKLVDGQVVVVSQQEIEQAMRLQSGYDPTTTTNAARFDAGVILHLVQQARAREAQGPPLLIGYVEWFQAYLVVLGLTAETAPAFARLAFEFKQDLLVDYRWGHVIKKIDKNSHLEVAANVLAFWPETPEVPAKYSFTDTLSMPNLKVTNNRIITYRLLDFGNMIVYDEVRGLSGKPTTGVLGMLFRMIGEGRLVQSKIAISKDGLQIARARVQKGLMKIATTATIQPDGHTEKGLPPHRADLKKLERLLRRPLRIRYMPFEFPCQRK
ncbi:MAG: hypothetical protein ACE5HO_19040 [bacterium]